MPIVYETAIAEAVIAESAKSFGDTYAAHVMHVQLGIEYKDWDGSTVGVIDLESLIWELNERHSREDSHMLSTNKAEREAFAAVVAQLYAPLFGRV